MSDCFLLSDNRFLDGTPTATSTAVGYSVGALTDWKTYTYWKAASASTQYLTVDCGSPKYADTLGIASHNLAAHASLITVDGSDDNVTWVTALAATASTSGVILLKLATPATRRYWRVVISNQSAASYIGILCLGARMQFEDGIDGEYTPYVETAHAEIEISQAGHMLGATLAYVGRDAEYSWAYITDGWFRNTFMPVWTTHLSLYKPFFFTPDYAFGDALLWRVKNGSGIDGRYYVTGRRRFSLSLTGIKL